MPDKLLNYAVEANQILIVTDQFSVDTGLVGMSFENMFKIWINNDSTKHLAVQPTIKNVYVGCVPDFRIEQNTVSIFAEHLLNGRVEIKKIPAIRRKYCPFKLFLIDTRQ